MTVQQIKLFIGEPGTGKTYQLTHLAKDLIQRGESVHIVCPTKSARDNIKNSYDEFLTQKLISDDENVTLKSSTQVLHGYDDRKATNLIIEEGGLIETTVLHGLLHVAQIVPNVNIYIYGDIKQLQPIQGTSVIEKIIRVNNLNGDMPFWEWVNKCAYSDIESQELKAPYDWQLPITIEMQILRKNYRLNKQGFNAYNDEYYSYLIDNTITQDDYSNELKFAIENDYLIITPTKDRGKEINETLTTIYPNAKNVSPFIIIRNEIYLNPFNQRYEEIAKKFYFIKRIKKTLAENIPLSYTAFITTHQAQGATVGNVCYYMGNKTIWKTHKNHYNNNQLYTAVTRARHEVMLLGLRDSFKEMRSIYPSDVSENLAGIRKKVAMDYLIRDLKAKKVHPDANVIYDMFLTYMSDNELVPDYELTMLNYYKVPQEPYSQRYVVSQVYRRVTNFLGFSNLNRWLKDNKKNATKEPRKGKVKKWIESLNDEELEKVKSDVDELSIRKFKDKYGYDKRYIKS